MKKKNLFKRAAATPSSSRPPSLDWVEAGLQVLKPPTCSPGACMSSRCECCYSSDPSKLCLGQHCNPCRGSGSLQSFHGCSLESHQAWVHLAY